MNQNPPSPVPVSPLPYYVGGRRWDNYVIALGVLAVVIGAVALAISVVTLPRLYEQFAGSPLQLLHFVLNWVPFREALVLLGGCALLWRSRLSWHLTVAYVATGLIRPVLSLAVLPWALREMRGTSGIGSAFALHSYAGFSVHAVALLAALFLLFHPSVRAIFDAWAAREGGSAGAAKIH